MPIFTYKVNEGLFITTDIEPTIWLEKFEVTEEQEQIIEDGANLWTDDGVLAIVTDTQVIEVPESN